MVDLPSLANKLKQRNRKFDEWLAAKLSLDTQAALSNYQGQGSDPAPLQKALLPDIKNILSGASIHEPQRFGNITLRSETVQLMSQNPQGSDLQRLNRLLIEDAYPVEVSRKNEGAPLLNTAPRGALIGRIGGSTADNSIDPNAKTKLFFPVGSYCVLLVPDSPIVGALFLGVNDSPARMGSVTDNLYVNVYEGL